MCDVIVEDESAALDQLGEAASALSCPYFRRLGVCARGCYEEPLCEVNTPEVGWVESAREALDKLERLGRS